MKYLAVKQAIDQILNSLNALAIWESPVRLNILWNGVRLVFHPYLLAQNFVKELFPLVGYYVIQIDLLLVFSN